MTPPVKFGINTLRLFFKSHKFSSVFVLADENTGKHCLPLIAPFLSTFDLIKVKSGEKNKSLQTCEFIWESLIKIQADRNSLLINLGGGVITDMGAFCAATYMRGIAFINIPTSFLGMADAGIGGKTGVDFLGYKNMIGSFSQPELICIDTQFLKTLNQRHLIAASAELFKHALLQNNKEVVKHLEKPFINFTEEEKDELIKKSVRFKSSIIAKDALEKNIRLQLNLGHTIGHALESYFINSHKPLLHGEAVALGLVAEIFIAHTFYNLSYETFLNVVFWYDMNFIKPVLTQVNFNTIEKLALHDKKNNNSNIGMVLLERPGHYTVNTSITNLQIREALKFLAAF
jgi:3-dehydroquinate synthase